MTSMIDQIITERSKESVASLIKKTDASITKHDVIVAMAESDLGVQRNLGRPGARWAPAALFAMWKKLTLPQNNLIEGVHLRRVGHDEHLAQNFVAAQELEAEQLSPLLQNNVPLLHIGGGHDHIKPLLDALSTDVAVINLDAHLDTRMDAESHSGNPFRLFADQGRHKFSLYQVGIHAFANSVSTQTTLKKGDMRLLMREDCDNQSHTSAFLSSLESALTPNTKFVFSLDCDAIEAAAVSAVSAPNHHGLKIEFVLQLVRWYKQLCEQRGQAPIWGIYEFNPIYDNVSGVSARAVAGLMYEMIF